jgi:hypothetical protein
VVQEKRVAVGLRLGDPPCAERAARARHVLDDLLAKGARHRFRDQAATVSVGPPAENGMTIVIVLVG